VTKGQQRRNIDACAGRGSDDALVTCPNCGSSDDLEGLGPTEDGRLRVRCSACENVWNRGEPKRVYKKVDTIVEIKNIFPSPADVDADTLARAEDLKRRFLATHATWSGWPPSDSFRAKYRRLFSREGVGVQKSDPLTRPSRDTC
jgi:hypothetical protein